MKKIFFCFFILFQSIFLLASINIAFVHKGPKLPSYIHYALIQARCFNKKATIYLICDKEAIDAYQNVSLFLLHDIQIILTDNLSISSLHKDIRKYYQASPDFRNGYWLKTVERFYYLEELMKKFDIKELFHFENDVLIYFEIESLIKIFRKHCHGIASVMKDDAHCAPGIVYISNVAKLSHYLDFLTKRAKHRSYELSIDMRAPVDYMKQFGNEYFNPLPVIMPKYVQQYGLKDQRGNVAKDSSWYDKNFELFNSVFDAAPLGIYFGGIDHRDRTSPTHGGPGYVFPGSMFDPSLFKYAWIVDGSNRKIPYLMYNQKKYRINNLHLHSKDLQDFISYERDESDFELQ